MVVTALFTHVARLLLRRQMPTLVAGLLFAAHPIHTEAVAGVVGRADILACLFFLLAFLSYMRYCKYRDKPGGGSTYNNTSPSQHRGNSHSTAAISHKNSSPNSKSQRYLKQNGSTASSHTETLRWCYLVATAALTAASMLSKEQGITVLAVCATYDVFLHSRLSVRQLPNILKVTHLFNIIFKEIPEVGTAS